MDTVGVAAMIPLTQLIGGAEPDSGVLGAISDATGLTTAAELIPVIAGAIAALFVVKSAAALWFRWWLLGRTSRLTADAATELLRRYVLAPYPDHKARRLSETYRNVNDATAQASSVLLAVIGIFTDVLMLSAIVIVLAATSTGVTLISVAIFVVLVAGIQRLLRRRQTRIGEEVAAANLEAWQFLLPSLDGFREARLTSSASVFIDRFHRARVRGANAARSLGILSDLPRYALEIGFVIAIGGVSYYLFATGTPQAAITVLGVFAAASLRALPTLTRVAANFAIVRTGGVGLDILLEVNDTLERGGSFREQPVTSERYAGDIELSDVAFSYRDSDRPIFEHLSLTIEHDRTVAFVGSSGAGKSTLLDLILGLLEPTAGSITCGGRSIGDDLAGWYRELGVVPQDVFLVNDTIRSNVAFGLDPSAVDDAGVQQALRMAKLTELIAELPDGVDTMVGERGVRLSGGQRQRIGLARALYRRPRVLVLDEATSALDNATEHEISETLSTLGGSMTIIIVAHRLSTVRNADSIVFLKDGKIEAQGSFAEVRANSTDFAHLVKLGELD
ncbi:ABC transporter ATP-binding protein [Microbacterium sp. ARD31]|uniref:ABC transporter ATP-binding protein n=1 Tax=Microbacterium sp. ARD31 TaxID=2962576 RepID=UPI00288229B6|nr:ABC transporter ATP-binding protein [Microbacterium sp. ARD31]MDT0186476.1 ABC transporter ATP-binding protein [Microbacterium sp. ARD31]